MVDDLTHWTREGTFKLKLVTLAASYFVEPWLNDTRLGTYGYPSTAAGSISRGEHDDALGFAASALNVPTNPADWNSSARLLPITTDSSFHPRSSLLLDPV